jgi:hypothetical protein
MDRLMLIAAAGTLFVLRDARLLRHASWPVRAGWAAANICIAACMAYSARELSRQELVALLAAPSALAVAALAHALHAAAMWLLRERRASVGIGLLPMPISVAATLVTAWMLTQRAELPWWVVAACVSALMLSASLAATVVRSTRSAATMFAAGVNVCVAAAFPLEIGPPESSPAPPVDWVSQAVPLLFTSALIGASYGWHRIRSMRGD